MIKYISSVLFLSALLVGCGGDDDDDKKPNTSSVMMSSSSAPASAAPSSVAQSSVAPSSTAPSSVAPSSVAPSSVAPSSVAAASSEPMMSSAPASSEPASSVASSSSAATNLTVDFELDAVESTYGSIGWDSPAVNATVVTIASVTGLDANGASTNVLRVVPLNWNSVPMVQVTIPQGKTLADYAVQFDVYFPYAKLGLTTSENYYKTLMLFAGTTITGAAEESNAAFQSKRSNASDNTPAFDEVDKWITLTLNVNSTKAALLTGTTQIALGINRPAGTNADAYYLDNIKLVELP